MWEPAERVFAASDITLNVLADTSFETDSALDFPPELQLRPQSDELASHVCVAAAVTSSCIKCGIEPGSFYEALT